MKIIRINSRLMVNKYIYEIITSSGIYTTEVIYDGHTDLRTIHNGENIDLMSFCYILESSKTSNKHYRSIINFLIDITKDQFIYEHRVNEINKIL